ncbi:MAG: hypothetical protein E7314_03475 [Clostridiales bacterium]|nr:hypothetical protein [Clostridiales bacterium]
MKSFFAWIKEWQEQRKVTVRTRKTTPAEINAINRAASRSTSSGELAELAKSKFVSVRCKVAVNPNISIETFLELAKDKKVVVRESLIYNKKTPEEIIIILTKDEDEVVRQLAESRLKNRMKMI